MMDPLSEEFYQARHADLEKRVTPKRLRHIEGVSETAERLAKIYGVDVAKARLAGLLHDWDKGYDDEGIRARAREVGFDVDPLVSRYMARTLHGETASRALAQEFPEIPADVIQAVDRHVTAVVGMEPLDMLVYVADAIEPNRPFDDVEHIRQQVGTADLEDLFFMSLAYWIERIIAKQCPMHPSTVATWNHYAIIQEDKHPKKRRQGC